jgi:hypothetical protein
MLQIQSNVRQFEQGLSASKSAAKRYAFRVFGLYCFIFYLIPALIILVSGNALELFLRPRPNYWIGFGYVLASFALFKWTLRLPIAGAPTFGRNIAKLAFGPRNSLIYAVFFVVFAVVTRSILGLNFRQTGGALAEVGAIGFALQFLKIFFGVSILIHLRLIYEDVDRKLRSVVLFLIAVGFTVSIQASIEVLFIICAVFGAGFSWRRALLLHLKAVRQLTIFVMPLVVVLIVFIGVANKQGIESATATVTDTNALLTVFSSRLSYHFTSTSMHVSDNFMNFDMFVEAINNILGTFYYRASLVLGFDGIAKPEVVSIARMNFLQIALDWRERTGISPSILGSTFFLPGAGFAIFYYVFIIRGVSLMIGRIMAPFANNIPFLLLSMFTLAGLLDAALDTLNPLGVGFTRLVFLYFGLVYVTTKLRAARIRSIRAEHGSLVSVKP